MMQNIGTIYYVKNKENNKYTYYSQDCAPTGARPVPYYTSKTIKVQQADGSVKIGYMYGEKTYSYDESEVEEYRQEQRIKKEADAKRRKLLAAIMSHYDSLDTETLEKIVEKGIDK